MGFKISSLWRAPEVNPINRKARSIPILNPFDFYGRVFFFSWFGFFIGSWSWYAFPPLTTVTIKNDLRLSQIEIANGNILALVSTVIVRASAGFACDRFGPRLTYVTLLLAGAIPTALAGVVHDAAGLIAVRCACGILGAAFVPCEVWATGFFDKNCVGAANAFAAGWGNMGGGITYFAMPAIFDSLHKHRGLSTRVAWHVTFVVPFILIVSTALLMFFFGEDSPSGPWSARHRALNQQLATRDMFVSTAKRRQGSDARSRTHSDDKIELNSSSQVAEDAEDPVNDDHDLLAAASWELVQKPSVAQSTRAVFSIHTAALILVYMCSFGAELTVVNILGAYYYKKFPLMGQTGSSNWASMFGFLNFFSRPLGGLISDAIYRPTGSLWGRKAWIHTVGLLAGTFACLIGFLDPSTKGQLFGLMVGLAVFTEAGNGATFSLVPHVYPASNGIIAGLTGASGTLGGVLFELIARAEGTNYPKVLWIIGIWTLGAQIVTCWIPPISKHQLGGR